MYLNNLWMSTRNVNILNLCTCVYKFIIKLIVCQSKHHPHGHQKYGRIRISLVSNGRITTHVSSRSIRNDWQLFNPIINNDTIIQSMKCVDLIMFVYQILSSLLYLLFIFIGSFIRGRFFVWFGINKEPAKQIFL